MQLAQRRNIDPLAPVDHSLVEYDDFAKDFYTEHPTIAAMSDQQVRILVDVLDFSMLLCSVVCCGDFVKDCYTEHPGIAAMTDHRLKPVVAV